MSQTMRNVLVVIFIAALCFVAYGVLTMPDQRSATDKVGDAVHELPNGVGKAGRELEDRTPGEKIGDAIKDNTKSQ